MDQMNSTRRLVHCDGRYVVFVGGYHHGGTTISQAELLKRGKNRDIKSFKEQERFPTPSARCATTWQIFKNPTNTIENLRRMRHLREDLNMPKMRMVFTTRDLPNTVWSVMKRFRNSTKDFMTREAASWCQVNRGWYASPRMNGPLDWTYDLGIFASGVNSVLLEQILPKLGPSGEEVTTDVEVAAARRELGRVLNSFAVGGEEAIGDEQVQTVVEATRVELEARQNYQYEDPWLPGRKRQAARAVERDTQTDSIQVQEQRLRQQHQRQQQQLQRQQQLERQQLQRQQLQGQQLQGQQRQQQQQQRQRQLRGPIGPRWRATMRENQVRSGLRPYDPSRFFVEAPPDQAKFLKELKCPDDY